MEKNQVLSRIANTGEKGRQASMSISLELPSRQPRRQDDQGFSVREVCDIVQEMFEQSAAI